MSLYARIDAVAAARGALDCWVVPGRHSWSFDDLRDGAARYDSALRSLGALPGDRVLVQVEKSPEALLLYLGCLRAGAVYVPLNTAYTAAEVRYFANDAQPRIIVCNPAREPQMQAVSATLPANKLVTLDSHGGGTLANRASISASGVSIVPRETADLAAILYTSGTTGRSKGAMLSHQNLTSNAETLLRLWNFSTADVLLHALPIYHVHGLFVATHCALLSGATTILLPKLDMPQVLSALPRATVLMGVPTYYTRLLAEPNFNRRLLPNMRVFICGSAPLLPATFQEFEQRTGHLILERYGMTEAGMIASNPYAGDRVAGTVGFALPGVQLRVADDNGLELPRGSAGVLEVRGPNVFGGYWRNPDKTASEFRAEGWFITGDIAVLDAESRVSIVGRAKDLIISGGFNVYPKEIELEIDSLPGVVESAVIGAAHADLGEAVIAVVACAPGHSLTERSILDALNGRLAGFKQPKRVFFVDDLPRNAMGKVQKAHLRETYRNRLRIQSFVSEHQ